MTRTEFADSIAASVIEYMESFDRFDDNPQLRVEPRTLSVLLVNGAEMLADLAYNDEAVESAAGAQGAATMDATDFQVRQNRDFYAVKSLLRPDGAGGSEVDLKAVEAVVSNYFK